METSFCSIHSTLLAMVTRFNPLLKYFSCATLTNPKINTCKFERKTCLSCLNLFSVSKSVFIVGCSFYCFMAPEALGILVVSLCCFPRLHDLTTRQPLLVSFTANKLLFTFWEFLPAGTHNHLSQKELS